MSVRCTCDRRLDDEYGTCKRCNYFPWNCHCPPLKPPPPIDDEEEDEEL